MPLISFPDVPASSGVPAVFRDVVVPSFFAPANVGLAHLVDWNSSAPRWGVYGEDGQPVLLFDTFLSVNFDRAGTISSFALEQGGFSSFNKVVGPYQALIKLAHAGDQATRKQMLSVLDRIASGTELYSVATPEIVYLSASLGKYLYNRSASSGSSLLVVELTFNEVRQTAVLRPMAQREPSGADQESGGQVQVFKIDPYPTRDQNKVGELEPIQ
ncbi:hypothetical protein [Achromobacter sp. UBA4530]|uniref:hypothetical protein n=1 Tax=Achromobacter sp. UBA4530 TaxID=1945912 RepID=UPI00257984D0|nr:hypothetical protein [Achromobacter sp. UBA4530]